MNDFGGITYEADRDRSRLSVQLNRVRAVMGDGNWHTLCELEERLGHPQQSIGARIRDLRKPSFGGHTIIREYVRRGLWQYRMGPEQLKLIA